MKVRKKHDLSWKETAMELFSAITTRKRAERSQSTAEQDSYQRQRERELADRRRQEASERREAEQRRAEIAAAIERRVRTHGSYFPGTDSL